MSIEVTGPDGAIHEFPDDTSPDVINPHSPDDA
jgi:hypothetical protein